jgi:acyl carrier protein
MATQSRTDVLDRLKKVLATELKMEPDEIGSDDDLVMDLGVDSADMVTVLFAIENEFDIEISDEEAAARTRVSQIVEGIEKKMDKQVP